MKESDAKATAVFDPQIQAAPASRTGAPLLEVCDLEVEFRTDEGTFRATDGVSWSVGRGQTVAIVGESGCGKSVTALSVLGLIPDPPGRIVGGRILFYDRADQQPIDLTTADQRTLCRLRGARLAMIFQEAMTALNPVLTVGRQIAEVIELHRGLSGRDAWQATIEMLRQVGIPAPADRARSYPHQISGGMRQRAMIAMALSCGPALLIADEPTTALDVTIQAQILDLLDEQQARTGMSLVIITHDLGVVARMADEVCVMYAGRVVERASAEELFDHPLHPYTRALLRCVPRLSDRRSRLEVIPGSVPDPRDPPAGCRFHPRCSLCVARCRDEAVGQPPLRELKPGHFVACHETQV